MIEIGQYVCTFIGQAVEESVYLKTEQVLEPVDEPLVSQLSSDEDDTTEQHGITVS